MHEEIAPVTRYHDQYIADPQHTEHVDDPHARVHDPEMAKGSTHVAAVSVRSSSEGTVQSIPTQSALMMLPDTPFFHLDLPSAVRAAERGLTRVTSSIASGKKVAD